MLIVMSDSQVNLDYTYLLLVVSTLFSLVQVSGGLLQCQQ